MVHIGTPPTANCAVTLKGINVTGYDILMIG